MNRLPTLQAVRSAIDKQDLMKLKSFFKAKDTVTRTTWQPAEWEKIFSISTVDRGLISRIYKELQELDTNKPNNPIKNGVQNSQQRNLK